MDMCFVHNPSEQYSASEVLDYLSQALEGIDPQRGNFGKFPPSFSTIRDHSVT